MPSSSGHIRSQGQLSFQAGDQLVVLQHLSVSEWKVRDAKLQEGSAPSMFLIKSLVGCPWYVGEISSMETETALRKSSIGGFVVRMEILLPARTDAHFIISLRTATGVTHLRLNIGDEGIAIKGYPNIHAPSIPALIDLCADLEQNFGVLRPSCAVDIPRPVPEALPGACALRTPLPPPPS